MFLGGRAASLRTLDQTLTLHRHGPQTPSDSLPSRPRANSDVQQTTSVRSPGLVNDRKSPLLHAFLVLLVNIAFGVIAGQIFSVIELQAELDHRTERAEVVKKWLNSSVSPEDWEELVSVLGHSAEVLERDVIAVEEDALWASSHDLNWDRSSSTFFAFTVATSIGYGSFAPVTPGGRGFLIVYALISVPCMLFAFATLCSELLATFVFHFFRKRGRDLPEKVFRMMDRNKNGTLCKSELLIALQTMGLGDFNSKNTTPAKRRKFDDIFKEMDRDGSGELDLAEFRQLLTRLVPDEDQVLILVDVVTRSYVAAISVCIFVAYSLLMSVVFVYIKRDEDWTFLDSLYFTVVTLLTVGFGDLAPDPHPYSYMVAYVLCTFFGLACWWWFMSALADPHLSFRASFRGLCHSWASGAMSLKQIKEGTHRSKDKRDRATALAARATERATANIHRHTESPAKGSALHTQAAEPAAAPAGECLAA